MPTKCRCAHGSPWFVVCCECIWGLYGSDRLRGVDTWDGAKIITLDSIEVHRLRTERDYWRHVAESPQFRSMTAIVRES